LSDAHAMLVH